ncbi:putative Transcription factor domain-containing protein [Seiridium cardinale]
MPQRTNRTSSTLLNLQERLQRLEGGLGGQATVATPSSIASGALESHASTNATFDLSVPNIDWRESVRRRRRSYSQGRFQNDEVGSVNETSTSHAFVRQVASAAEGLGESSSSGSIRLDYASRSDARYGLENLALPTRYLADDLLAWYWDFIHPLIPVLHRPGFMVRYDQLWQPRNVSTSSGAADDIIFHATLNMVLALGCQRNEQFEPAERANLSYEFYKRSVKIVSVDTLDESSLSVVQLLMLRGLYLLYSPYADRCWNMTAITIRIAQAIGLESLSYHSSSLDQLTREMRRRVWYSCIVLDRYISIARVSKVRQMLTHSRFTGLCFGRHQFLVSSSSIPLPSEIDDEYLSSFDEGRQPKNSSSRLTYFNQSFKLSTIGDRWQKLNDKHIQESTGRYSTQELGTIVDIYAEIERYHEQLPAHLQGDGFSRAFEDSKCFKLQAHTLKARIIYMKLWSLRPCLISEVRRVTMPSSPHDIGGKRTTSEQLEQRLRDDVCTLCVVAAHDVLDELHRMLSGMQRTSPWHALFFTFAAASVLVVATLCPSLDVDLGQEPAKTSWTRATEIFQFHSRHVPSAEKGVAALEVLRRSVTLRKSELEKNECVVDAELGSLAAEIETEAPFQDEWLGFKDFIDPESLDFSWFTMQGLDFQ